MLSATECDREWLKSEDPSSYTGFDLGMFWLSPPKKLLWCAYYMIALYQQASTTPRLVSDYERGQRTSPDKLEVAPRADSRKRSLDLPIHSVWLNMVTESKHKRVLPPPPSFTSSQSTPPKFQANREARYLPNLPHLTTHLTGLHTEIPSNLTNT